MKTKSDNKTGSKRSCLLNGHESLSRKRRHSSSDDKKKSKIHKFVEKCSIEGGNIDNEPECSHINLLSLSDEVLFIILSNLGAVDLMSLRKCCQKLAAVASDWTLWMNVEFRSSILKENELLEYMPLLRETTKAIATRGFVSHSPDKIQCLSEELLSKLGKTCHALRSFIAEEHFIDAHSLQITHFPSTLRHLSLKGSKIDNLPTPSNSSYFSDIHTHLPLLQVLELSDCTGLPPWSIVDLCKLPRLEELRLDGSRCLEGIKLYASVAFNLGFKTLKVLDLRRTGVCNKQMHFINLFNRLTHLHLERNRSPNPNRQNANDFCLDYITSDGLQLLRGKPPIYVVTEDVKDGIPPCRLHTLVARHYPRVTDATLRDIRDLETLRYLDLTGTEISKSGAAAFRKARPDVTLVTSFDSIT